MFISDHPKAAGIVHINAEDLIEVNKCRVCSAERFEKIGVYREDPEIHFVRCQNCQSVTYDRIFKQSAIDAMYNEEQYYDDTEESGKVTFYGTKRFADHLMKYCKRINKPVIRMLDLGGGDGAVSYALARQFCEKYNDVRCEITVVDYGNLLYKKNDEKISMTHCFPIDSIPDDNHFDILIASAVLEHIPDAGNVFRKLFSLMDYGSVLYFRTPYRYPLYKLAKHFGIEFDMLYPGHIWDFGGHYWWKRLPECFGVEKDGISVIASRPSIVEKTFRSHFFVALASYLLKAPWYICHKWPYVGGWEAVYTKKLPVGGTSDAS